MSWLESVFQFPQAYGAKDTELPEIFPMPIPQASFISNDVATIYAKLLTDVLERTHGLADNLAPLLWDNCVKSSSGEGLVTLLAKSMEAKADLYLVYDSSVNVVRVADNGEQAKIRSDYERSADSTAGVYISFKNYKRSDMLKLYSALEYATIAALNKSLNISSAPQFKFTDLRASTAMVDSGVVVTQAQGIAKALLSGRPIMLDAKDMVETATPDLASTEKAMEFISGKLAFYLGMPSSYITGTQTGGIGSTGEADTKAVERGLKSYFFSVIRPTLTALFGGEYSYKSQDTTNIGTGLEVLKTFAITDDDLISHENKLKIVNQVFDLPEDSEGDAVEPVKEAAPNPAALGSKA